MENKPYIVVPFMVIAISFFYFRFIEDGAQNPFYVAQHLQNIAENGSSSCKKIAIGYNSNLDLIVKAPNFMKKLGHFEFPRTFKDHEKLNTIEEFLESMAFHFDRGSAAERFVASEELFDLLIKTALSLSDDDKHWFIGGNAALMANRFAKENCTSILLGGIAGERLQSLLPPVIKVIQDDKNIGDQIHLILEYEKNSKWGNLVAPRANRFIIVRDIPNSLLYTLETFHSELSTFEPQLIVLSGLHLLEGQLSEYRSNRLQNLHSYILNSNTIPLSVPIHLELASIGDFSFMKQIFLHIIPYVNSLGLNEQELFTLYSSLGGSNYSINQFKEPTIRTVIDTIRFVLVKLDTKNVTRHLTRVHFHCLHFHVIVEIGAKQQWDGALNAVAAGSLAATFQACNITSIHSIDANLVDFSFPNNVQTGIFNDSPNIIFDGPNVVQEWKEGGFNFYLAPVLVCKYPKKTVGLGDAISAIGLLHHKFVT